MAENSRAVMSEPTRTDRARILVVEGYSHSREGLSTSLRGDRACVETAGDCQDAIHKLNDGHFDAAIIDVDLRSPRGADLSGWDVARVFRALHPTAALILVTAEWRPELGAAATRLRDCRLIEKPINPAELRATVRALHAQSA
jgi:DNA-binding response OmpR family regulator